MGGPGSGRRTGQRGPGGRFVSASGPPPFPVGHSRVELEPVLARDLTVATPESLAEAEAIRAELAGRTWQGTNPYADWLPA